MLATEDLGYQGIDCAAIIPADAAQYFASIGKSFVGRYLTWGLSAEEAKNIHDAGLAILIFYEEGAADVLGEVITDEITEASRIAYDSAERGFYQGAKALEKAEAIGVPKGTCIYFCCDTGVNRAQTARMDRLEAFLHAATKALKGKYKCGIYGGVDVIDVMASRNACDCYCQCVAWSSGQLSQYADVYQYAWQWDSRAEAIHQQVGFYVDLETARDLDAAGMWFPDGHVTKVSTSTRTVTVEKLSEEISRNGVAKITSEVFVPRTVAPTSDEYWWRSDANPCQSKLNGTVLPNCFVGSTQFITNHGVITLKKGFDLCNEGKVIEVPTVDGEWHQATVKYFGVQPLYQVKLENSKYFCTGNHRWLIQTKRGQRAVTTLELRPSMRIPYRMCNTDEYTHPVSVKYTGKSEGVYCVVEPKTRSFTLAGGEITGNCVGYAYGRFSEILGKFHPDLPTCDAGKWLDNIKTKKTDLKWGSVPKLGAVAVWKKHDKPGHLAIVEYINSDGTIMFSESSYAGDWGKRFWNSGPRSSPTWYNDGTYSFQGFIYNPGTENVKHVAPYNNPTEYGKISENSKSYATICAEYLMENSNVLNLGLTGDYVQGATYQIEELHPARKLLQAAIKHLGKDSHEWVLQSTGVAKNQGWSAAMICAAVKECEFESLEFPTRTYGCTDYCKKLVENFKAGTYFNGGANGGSTRPQTGDIFAIYTGPERSKTKYSATRVGLVRETQGDRVLTVEGDLQDSILLNQRRLRDIAFYIRPDWKQEGASEDCPSLIQPVIYDKLSTSEDATLREVGYVTNEGKPSIKSTDIRLSTINYTTTLSHIMSFYAMKEGSKFATTSPNEIVYSSSTGKSYVPTTGFSVDSSRLQPQNARIIFDYLLEKGLTAAQAMGFVVNIKYESNFNTSFADRQQQSAGICRWVKARRNAMVDACNAKWSDNLTGQLDFMWSELQGAYSTVLTKLRAEVTDNTVTDAKNSVRIVLIHYLDTEDYEDNMPERQNDVSNFWSMITVMDNATGASSESLLSNKILTKSGVRITVGESIPIPSWVKQSGISANSSPYDTLFNRWARSLAQGKLADLWDEQGRPTKYTIATLNGYFIGGCTTTLAMPGDIISVVLEDDTYFNMIVGDSKGANVHNTPYAWEDGNEYGHYLGDKSLQLVDIIEWESDFSIPDATNKRIAGLKQAGFYGKKVVKVINYGSWIDR